MRRLIVIAVALGGCSAAPTGIKPVQEPVGGADAIGVVILVDTSGSMADTVADGQGGRKPKDWLAQRALIEIMSRADVWTRDHHERPLNLAILSFTSKVQPVLLMGRFDSASAHQAVISIPRSGGSTAVGTALCAAWDTLLPLHCGKAIIVCITDGASNSGERPQKVLPRIKAAGGEVYFVAFDVDPKLFGWADHVAPAADGPALDAALDTIFTKRVFIEER